MLDLVLDTATVKTVNGHQYYVFPTTLGHANQTNRPANVYANPKDLKVYQGAGAAKSATKLLPSVHGPAHSLMTALRRYGDKINDWSMKSAVIQSGYRPDDASQGANYLRITKLTIKRNPKIFGDLEFPAALENEAQSELGMFGDPRFEKFKRNLGSSPGWTPKLAETLLREVAQVYTPRGVNPHATGFVFDLDFSILDGDQERQLGANTSLNTLALRSAAGRWLNQYSMMFGFDSYDTRREIWHMEYRSPKKGVGSPEYVALLECCQTPIEFAEAFYEETLVPVWDAVRPLIGR